MSLFLKFLTAHVLLALVLVWGGCGQSESASLGPETDDPVYREAKQLDKQGRPQEALSAYLKVIASRGEVAPESHLDAGIIYKQHIKDQVAAIYHFRKYLEQQPNSRQAPFVRRQIEAAKREFGLSFPSQPSDSREVRMDGFDQRDRLERENEQLRAELSVLRGGGGVGGTSRMPTPRAGLSEPRETPPAPAEEEPTPITLAPLPAREGEQMTVAPSTPAPKAPASTSPSTGVRAKPTPPSAAGGRRHTVAPKESLYAIAKKYYGAANNARVQAIIQANRDVLGPDNALKPGMELKIP